jgi:hypothetical protein
MTDEITGNKSIKLNAETYVHETGHLLGLDDYYGNQNNYGPLGGFDMMSYNVGDHGPLNKMLLGWIDPLIAQPGTKKVTLDRYATGGGVILIPKTTLPNGSIWGEFIALAYYTPAGLYEAHQGLSYVPSVSGLLVYHVDATLKARNDSSWWMSYFKNTNMDSDNSKSLVRFLEADKNSSMASSGFKNSDLLSSGSLALNTYRWNSNSAINIGLQILSKTDASIEVSISF